MQIEQKTKILKLTQLLAANSARCEFSYCGFELLSKIYLAKRGHGNLAF